jgi:hypothetical protein
MRLTLTRRELRSRSARFMECFGSSCNAKRFEPRGAVAGMPVGIEAPMVESAEARW